MVKKAFKFTSLLMFFAGFFLVNPVTGQDVEETAAERTARLSSDYNDQVMHHISNANEFHVFGDIHIPLPCILYAPDKGLDFFMSSEFHHGSIAVEGYVLDNGVVRRIVDGAALNGEHLDPIKHHGHGEHHEEKHEAQPDGEGHGEHSDSHEDGHSDDDHAHDEKGSGTKGEDGEAHRNYVEHTDEGSFVYVDGKKYALEKASTLMAFTSWFDFSISKNVFSMLLATLLLFIVFRSVANGYKKRAGQAPKGIQSLMEPIIIFMRDEVAKPALGDKWPKYLPFILSLFFFVLFNNLFGIIPFFPFSANVTGNVGTTLALAVFTFFVTNLSGNKHYWEHTLWMPGIPTFVKPILTVIEVAGLFIKPFTLFIRLFANITAGHIIILSLVGLVWTFGDYGASASGSAIGAVLAFLFAGFINILELFVAFLQAFIFAMLSALYIGSAIEEHHHDDHEHAHAH